MRRLSLAVRSPRQGAWLLPLLALSLAAPGLARAAQGDTPANTLSAAEKAAGWKLLFDGKSLNGWHGFGLSTPPPTGWVVEDGLLKHLARKRGARGDGDLITDAVFESFEFRFDWRIAEGANSGVKYGVDEPAGTPRRSALGMEYQLVDDERHPDAKDPRRVSASLYSLLAPVQKAVHPAGEWNQGRIVVRGSHVEHWLNGVKTVEYELGSEAIRGLVAASKFKATPGFATSGKGHVVFQDHGGEVWFRNVKVRELPR